MSLKTKLAAGLIGLSTLGGCAVKVPSHATREALNIVAKETKAVENALQKVSADSAKLAEVNPELSQKIDSLVQKETEMTKDCYGCCGWNGSAWSVTDLVKVKEGFYENLNSMVSGNEIAEKYAQSFKAARSAENNLCDANRNLAETKADGPSSLIGYGLESVGNGIADGAKTTAEVAGKGLVNVCQTVGKGWDAFSEFMTNLYNKI